MKELDQLITATKQYNAGRGVSHPRIQKRNNMLHRLWKKVPGGKKLKRLVASFLILGILVSILVPLWENPIPESNSIPNAEVHDYKQEKVAEGAYKLTGRDPIKQTLTKPAKVDVTLKENTKAIDSAKSHKEAYRWEVKLSSGTVFAFGRQKADGIEPAVKVTNKDGLFVRYYPTGSVTQDGNLQYVKPQVKENVVSWEVSPGIIARYTMQQNGVKADYIVSEKKYLTGNKLDFVVDHSEEIIPELMPDQEILWLKDTKEIFSFPEPVIQESVKKKEWEGEYALQSDGIGTADLSIILPTDKLADAVFPLTVDPQVIDSAIGSSLATAYGNGRQILRDAYGNLFAIFDGGTGDDGFYKSHNSNTWTAMGFSFTNALGMVAADIDSEGNIHILGRNVSTGIDYFKVTIVRNGSNAVSSANNPTTLTLNSSTVNRPSLVIANKGAGAGKEKVVAMWPSNTTNRGEVRVMQCDVADDCSTAANWKNASEEKNASGTCSDTNTAGNKGIPNSGTCKGVSDALFATATTTTHHGVVSQMPMVSKWSPDGVKTDYSGSFTDRPNYHDNNSATTTIFSLNSNDYLYIGSSKKFSKASFDFAGDSTTASSWTLEYWNGSSYSTVSNLDDNTSSVTTQPFEESGSMLFDEPGNWQQNTVDGDTMYWIRINLIGSGSYTLREIYLNDRNSGALIAIGGDDGTDDLRAAYVTWDDIANDKWENIPSSSSNAWREDAGGASSSLEVDGANWGTFTNYPLSATVDYSNNRVYVGYLCDNGSSICAGTFPSRELRVRTAPINQSLIHQTSWSNVDFPGVSEQADVVLSLTADQGDIYLFYVLDPDTTGLVYRKCSPGGGDNGNICDNASNWGSEQTLIPFVSTSSEPTHPQPLITKAFGDTIAIDVIYTNIKATPSVEYERTYIDLSDKAVTVAASTDDAYQVDCDTGNDIQNSISTWVPVGYIAAGGECPSGGGAKYHTGIRFPNVTVSQGSIISSAYLDIQARNNTSDISFVTYGEDANNAGDFDTIASCTPTVNCVDADGDLIINERPRTTNSVSLSLTPETIRYRIDVTDIVQEIVCRGASNVQPCIGDFNGSGSWTSGNALALLLLSSNTSGTRYMSISSFNDSAGQLNATLQINLGTVGKNYSMGSAAEVATGSASFADLDHPLSTSQMAAVATDDTHYASVAASTNFNTPADAQPAFVFKVNNSNNNNKYFAEAAAVVKSSLASSTKPIHLQVYQGGFLNDWVTVATDNNTDANTDITFNPPVLDFGIYDNYMEESPGVSCTASSTNCWTYWRIYQEAPDTDQNAVLYVDYFTVDYLVPTPSRIVFTTGTQTMQHNVCNGAAKVITMQLQDVNFDPANPTQSTVVRVTSNSSGETMYTDDTCTTVATNGDYTFSTGENTKNIYIKDTSVSSPTWTLTATRQSGDTLTSDTEPYTILGATKVVFTNPGRVFDVLACNGAANVFTIQLQDITSTAITPTASTVIRITSDSGDYTIYSDDTCTTPATNGDFTFSTADTTKSVYIIEREVANPFWTLTATKQSGPETITADTQNYFSTAISTHIRGGLQIRGGTTIR